MEGTIEVFNGAGIGYHLVAGSALGLERHRGLIPWDDDVDFGVHSDSAARIWALKDEFARRGYGIVHADIGFKMGTGKLIEAELQDIGGVPTAGTNAPFTGTNQDIFLFREDGVEKGVPVMRYTSERARKTWPREVIPAAGWHAPPTFASFGGYTVRALPRADAEWYLSYSYGSNWKTRDGEGRMLKNPQCAWHSSYGPKSRETLCSA